MKGVHASAKFASICAIAGLIVPMTLIIALAITWIFLGKPLQIHFSSADILPSMNHTGGWIALTAIMSSFLGMELATVHVKDVNNPKKVFLKLYLFP